MRLLTGESLADEYKAAGRSSNVGGLVGIQHSKLLFAKYSGNTHVLIGSANWSTSSRCNVEVSVHLTGNSQSEPMQALEHELDELFRQGIELTVAETLNAQRSRSQSPRR